MATLRNDTVIRSADGQGTAAIVTASNIGTYGVATNSTYYVGTTQNIFNRASGAQTLTGVSIDGNAATVTNGVYTTGAQTIGGTKTFSDGVIVNGATYYTFNKPTTNAYQTVALFGSASAGLFLTTDSAIIGVGAYYNNGWIATATSGRQIDFAGGTFTFNAFSGATVGGAASWGTVAQLSSAGVFSATGDFRAPIFYDSNNTAYYIDAASTSNLNVLVVAASARVGGAASRSTSGLTVGFTDNSTFAANSDVGDTDRMLSIVNESSTTNAMSVLGFRVNPNGGTANAMLDIKYVQTGATNTSALHYTFNHGGTFADRFTILSSGNVGIGTTSPNYKLDVNGTFRTATNNLTIFNDYLYVSPTENNTFNSAYSTNGIADMWINYAGYNNGNTQFRNFNVGNGKNGIIAWFDGTNKRMSINNNQAASYPLHVVGTAYSDTDFRAPIFYDSANTAYYLDPANTGTSLLVAGNVGIGTTSPATKLEVASTSDGILTLNKSSGTAWNYINFSQAGTRRFYFGLNASFEPELGVDNGGTFRVVGGMTVAGNAVLTSTSTLTAGNLSGTIPSGVLGNSTHYVGTTAIALNRASASQTLTGISIDGNAATATNGLTTSNYVSYSAFTGAISSGGAITATSYIYTSTYLQTGGNLIYPSGYGSTQRLEVGNSANNNWIDGLTIAPGGTVTAPDNMRSPIFYDSANTAYYVDPAGTSNLNALVLSGASYFRPQTWIQMDGSYGMYWPNTNGCHIEGNTLSTYGSLAIRGTRGGWKGIHFYEGGNVPHLMFDGSANGGVYFETGGRWASYYSYSNNCWGFATSTTNSAYNLYVPTGVYSGGRVDGTIFYDSNNTAYYIDAASTSRLNIVHSNYYIGEITDSGNGDANAPFRFESDYSGWSMIFAGTPGSTNGWGTFWAGNDNPAYYYFGASNPNEYVFVGAGSLKASIDLDNGQSYFATSLRSPIFYDSDNTAYYLDPASTSNLNNITAAGTLTVTNIAKNSTSPIVINSGLSSSLGLRVYYDMNLYNTLVFTDSAWNSQGTISGSSSVVTINAATATTSFVKYAGYSQEGGSFRAPIFYDSNDTAYYVDPASTSRVNTLYVANVLADSASVNGRILLYGNLHIDAYGANDIYCNYYSGKRLRAYKGAGTGAETFRADTDGIIYAFEQFRTPIVYDYNNTAYYLDPASTSAVNRIDILSGSAAINTTTPGTSAYQLNFTSQSTADYAQAITWGWSTSGAEAGIYVQSSGGYGTKMYIATTDSFATGSKTAITIDHTGIVTTNRNYLQATGSVRAPIFYDSDNTVYYLDPANTGTSLLVAGNVGIGTTSPGYKLDITGDARIASAAGAGALYFGTTDPSNIYLKLDNSYDLSLAQNAASGNGLYLAGAGNVYLSIDSNNNETDRAFIVQKDAVKAGAELFRVQENGVVTASSDFRAPIFYDSNNTAYYIDAASGSNLNTVNANRFSAPNNGLISIGDDSATQTYNDGSTRSRLYVSSTYPAITLNSTVTSGNGNHGPTIQFTFNGYDSSRQWVIGSGGTGQQLDFGTAQPSNKNPHEGIAGYSGTTCMRMTVAGNVGIGGNWGYYGTVENPSYRMHVQGTGYASGDFRAPIFYDSNNTAYYLDPAAGTSLRIAGAIVGDHAAWTGEQNKIQWHSSHLYFQNTSDGYFIFRKSNGAEPFQLRISEEAGYATGSWRAPIFYDSNDTAYYVDPRSTSVLSGLKLNGIDNEAAGTGSDAILWINKPNNNDWAIRVSGNLEYLLRLEGATSHTYNIQGLANGSEFWRCGTDLLYHNSNIRAPIFYDNNDTAYYVDPASATISSNLKASQAIGRYKTFAINDLSAGSINARTYEIARIAIDYNDWNTIGTFEVELHEQYWSQGLKKVYNIWYGYVNDYGIRLVEWRGSGSNGFQCRIGSPVQVVGDQYYLPIYIDVRNYSIVDVVIKTNRNYTTSSPPAIGYTYINTAPSASNITDFTPDNDLEISTRTTAKLGGNVILTAANYNSYSPTLTGTGASGTWSINVTGNASGTAGSISGYNNPTTAATANTIVYRDANGHIFGNYILGGYFNSSAGNSENPTIGQIWTQSTADNYLRKSTPAHFRSQVTDGSYPSLTGANASGTWNINITGNANNITQYTVNQSVGTANTPTFSELTLSGVGMGAYNFMKYSGLRSGDWQTFTTTEGQLNVIQVNNITGGGHTNYPTGVYPYGAVMSWKTTNHSFQLYAAHTGDLAYKTQWNNDNNSGWRRILDSTNYPYAANMNQYVRTTDNVTHNIVDATQFRDSNDTSYYLDLNSSGSLIRGRVNITGGHGGSSLRVFLSAAENGATTGVTTLQQWCSEPGNSWDGAGFGYNVDNSLNEAGNVPVYYFGRPNTSFGQAYMRMTTDGNWYFYNTPNGSNTRHTTMVLDRTGYVLASNSIRSPIFHDSDNTVYYVDPASTSNLVGLTVVNTITGSITGNAGGSSASCTGNSATTTLATKATRANGNFYIDDNYGNTVVGVYSASRYQGVFAMGDSYKLAADGTTTGSLYGIGWSHPNAGGVAANLNTHGALIMENGTFLAALSGSIRCRDDMRSPLFYDSNNTGYYVDPASTSNLAGLTVANTITGSITGSAGSVAWTNVSGRPTAVSSFSNDSGYITSGGSISGSSGSCTGNAASVTDGVYLSTNQSISGVKTFSSAPVATNIAKAWVHYNMNNNTINASYNVSSVTDNGTGVCTVNFSTSMVDANYVVAGTATYGYDDQDIYGMILTVPRRSTAQQAGSCRLATEYIHAAQVYDCVAVRAVFYR